MTSVLTCDPGPGVAGEKMVQNRVRDLVGDLVRMALGDALGREERGMQEAASQLERGNRARTL